MKKTLLKLCSYALVFVFVLNVLPVQTLATEFRENTAQTAINREVTVLEECEDRRTEYTKEFLMTDGTRLAAVYARAVHYEKDGQWEEIDNTLISSGTGKDAVYTNTAGPWQVTFPRQLRGDNRVTVTKDGYTLSFGMAGELHSSGEIIQPPIGGGAEVMRGSAAAGSVAGTSAGASSQAAAAAPEFSVTAASASTARLESKDTAALREQMEHPELVSENTHSRLSYVNVYGTTDIAYDLNANQVKESIIIKSYDPTLQGYSYIIETQGLTPVLQDNSRIHFMAPDGETVVMVMPAPYMVDANNEYSDDIQVTLTPYQDGYKLTYLLINDWLADEDRAFPVILDPVIQPDMHIDNIYDQTVFQNRTYDYEWGILECGYDVDWAVERFFLKYENLPALSSADVIVDAQVNLYLAASSNNSCPVEVHKVNGDWSFDTITWSNAPTHDNTVEDFKIVHAEGWYTWNVTDIARKWYTGANTGMVFKASDAVENAAERNWKQFYSCNYSDSMAPSLIIQFRNNNGLESYWDYTASSAGRAGTGYINDYTGNLIWVRSDMGFGGNRMPVSISHIYNANDSLNNDFDMGYGWRTNFNQRVYRWSENSDYYIWEDSDGTKHYFYWESWGTYKDEDGLELTLTNTGSGDESYTITDKYGNKSYFDSSGRLSKQQNNQQTASTITVTYSSGNQISTVTDGAGRVYSFAYANGLLTRISFKGKGDTELSYVTFGYTGSQLTSVTDKDGETCYYSYTTNNLLSSAQDIDGYKLNYTYNTLTAGLPSRVATVTEYDGTVLGGALTVEYAQNQTIFTDHNNNKQILQFNNWGNTVSVQDGLGRAQLAQYATDTSSSGKGNQLTVASKLQYSSFLTNETTSTRNNLIVNGDFSGGLNNWTVIGSTTNNGISTVSTPAAPAMDTSSLFIQGTHTEAKGRQQTVSVSGAAGDTFVLAGWAKGTSVPLDPEDTENPSDFAVRATFHYTDGETKDFFARFNPYKDSTGSWQYAAAPMVAEKAYTSITVAVIYNYNANTVYFDGIQLYKEEFGNSYTYDAEGNVTSVRDVQAQTTTYEYVNNNLTSQTLPTGAKLTYTYDNYHNVLTATSTTGVVSSFTYDAYGNNTSVSVGSGTQKIQATATYTTDGNLLSTTTDTLGNVTTYGYNINTGVLEWTQAPGETGTDRTIYTYDDMFRTTGVSKSGSSVSYTYSADDLLSSLTSGSGTQYSFTYGLFDQISSIKIGETSLISHSYTEDVNRRLAQSTYGNGDHISYTYDNYGRVTSKTYEDGDTVTYTYDSSGALATVTDSATGITTTYYYDFTQRLMKYVESGSGTSHSVQYGYDDINNLTSLVETINGTVYTETYSYDNDNRLTGITNGSVGTTVSYDSFSRMDTVTAKDGNNTVVTTTVDYKDPSSTTTSTQVTAWTNTTAGLTKAYSYTYDNRGNIISVSDGTNTVTYAYDTKNQLTRENNPAANKTWVYSYDAGGNITSRTEYPYTTGDLGTATATVNYTYSDSAWKDLLTGYNGNTITSDAIGNMLSDGTWTYTWEHGRQLTGMEKSGTSISYAYNVDGLRTEKTVNGTATKYVYQGSKLVQMTRGSDSLYFTYDSIGAVGVKYNNTQYYYLRNAQGDIVGIVNASGTIVVEYTYDAWGNILTTTGSMATTLGEINPLRYRGYVYDTETGLYYLQSRYYNPELGRFINADAFISTGQGILGNNMFAYCYNNPTVYSDPSGRWAELAAVVEVFTVVIAAAFTLLIESTVISSISTSDTAQFISDNISDTILAIVDIASTQVSVHARTQKVKETLEKSHSVYVLKDAGGNVQYVGRTTNTRTRKNAHSQNPFRRGLSFEVVADNLNYIQARGVEQVLMLYYHTINPQNKMNNQINGISLQNQNADIYIKSAEKLLGYIWNQVSNELLCWAEQ